MPNHKETKAERNARMSRMGKKIHELARKYRHEHPGAKYQTAMKEAGKKYRSHHHHK